MSKDIHKGHRKRVKDKYIKNGLDSFADHEVLELLLYYCYPMIDTNEKAHKMINEFGTLHNLFDAHPLEIVKNCDVTENVAVLVSLIPELSKRYNIGKWDKKIVFNSRKKLGDYIKNLFIDKYYECFYLICLDSQGQLIFPCKIADGTIDEAPVYTRIVIEECLKYKASSVVMAHNHPSGELIASRADIEVTRRIKSALETIDVELIDHIIVAGDNYMSFYMKKLLD